MRLPLPGDTSTTDSYPDPRTPPPTDPAAPAPPAGIRCVARVEILTADDPPLPRHQQTPPLPLPLLHQVYPALLQVALCAAADEEQRLALQAALEVSLPVAFQGSEELQPRLRRWLCRRLRACALPGRLPRRCESEYAHAAHERRRHRRARDHRARGILQSVLPRPRIHRIRGRSRAGGGRGGRAGEREREGSEDTGCEGGVAVGWVGAGDGGGDCTGDGVEMGPRRRTRVRVRVGIEGKMGQPQTRRTWRWGCDEMVWYCVDHGRPWDFGTWTLSNVPIYLHTTYATVPLCATLCIYSAPI
ncbi:hypothetical protein B0H14DRAFT_991193 [Mycena olivaceomarginata]|nr:hypothetical protein B0H14DRAFT_991193 [Mycena olivaceomarginata]